MRWTPAYHTACLIQRKLLATMDSEKTTPAAMATLAKAWEALEDRKRILRNHGLPKPIESGVGKKYPRRTHLSFEGA